MLQSSHESIAEGTLVPMPPAITHRVAEALAALYRHPERALLPWYRYAIYSALTTDHHADRLAARAWIDIVAVRHVLFCWRPAAHDWPSSWLQPEQLLALAEQLILGGVDRSHVRMAVNRAQALADVAGEEASSRHYCSWCVYEAALRALQNAWSFSQSWANCEASGALVDTTTAMDDASTYAAIAVAGGTWQPLSSSASASAGGKGRWDWQTDEAQLRRAVFWEWWLRDAVPAAWDRAA
ncbi:MAG TPA: Imm5 family immunity protein [Roseiflexaceae bacterium]|nr:Imm5 family immunity protein [Roseiflexaceae bacterium]